MIVLYSIVVCYCFTLLIISYCSCLSTIYNLGKATVNNYETWQADTRYSNGYAANIEHLAERLIERAASGSALSCTNNTTTNNNTIGRNTNTTVQRGGSSRATYANNMTNSSTYVSRIPTEEHNRILNKVYHATEKLSDPMCVFSQFTDPLCIGSGSMGGNTGAGRGVVVGHIPTAQLKDGFQRMGTNLTDREFDYLLNYIGTTTNSTGNTTTNTATGVDGKVSLAEVDRILHNNITLEVKQQREIQREELLKNPRYTRTYQVSDPAVHTYNQPEYNTLLEHSKLAQKDSMNWSKLQGKLQENCHNLPLAFRNSALYVEPNMEYCDMSEWSRGRGASKRPSSAPSGGSGYGHGHSRSHSLTDYYRKSLTTTSLSASKLPPAGCRPNRYFFADDTCLPYTSSSNNNNNNSYTGGRGT